MEYKCVVLCLDYIPGVPIAMSPGVTFAVQSVSKLNWCECVCKVSCHDVLLCSLCCPVLLFFDGISW